MSALDRAAMLDTCPLPYVLTGCRRQPTTLLLLHYNPHMAVTSSYNNPLTSHHVSFDLSLDNPIMDDRL
ncbi:hypothetical protein CCACVL1_19697 [Corchorus capsularis]|uniref:Uncharacterized protein n=1 Tax=Corchorus capsularis TaxID=210143 RepID=A0A1R3HFB6_COCAP|nr:hypothetical protein CCACVL1_19697 [Corchorus capsularis]